LPFSAIFDRYGRHNLAFQTPKEAKAVYSGKRDGMIIPVNVATRQWKHASGNVVIPCSFGSPSLSSSFTIFAIASLSSLARSVILATYAAMLPEKKSERSDTSSLGSRHSLIGSQHLEWLPGSVTSCTHNQSLRWLCWFCTGCFMFSPQIDKTRMVRYGDISVRV
jgi:hypothetical protein